MIPAQTLDAAQPSDAADPRLVARADPRSAAAEQFRILHERLVRLAARRPMRIVAFTSAARGEGRTTTAANLAFTAAAEGRATVLVEADLRRPTLATLLGLAPRAGLGDVLLGTAELGQAVVHAGPLAVLCAGQVRDPAAAVRSPRAPQVMEQLRSAYELVVFDAPPALAFTDGDRLVGGADAVVLVVRAGATPREVVRLALESLGERGAGVVLNDVDPGTVTHGRWIFAGPDDDRPLGRRRSASAP